MSATARLDLKLDKNDKDLFSQAERIKDTHLIRRPQFFYWKYWVSFYFLPGGKRSMGVGG